MEVDDAMGEMESGKRASEVAQLLLPMVKKRKAVHGTPAEEGVPRLPGQAPGLPFPMGGPARQEGNREAVEVSRRVQFFHRAVAEAMERMDLPSRLARIRILVDALTPLTTPGTVAQRRAGDKSVSELEPSDGGDKEREERERDRAALPGVVELAGILQASFFDASAVHRIALEIKVLRRRGLDVCAVLDTLTCRITGGTLTTTQERMGPSGRARAERNALGVGDKRVRDVENVPAVQQRERRLGSPPKRPRLGDLARGPS